MLYTMLDAYESANFARRKPMTARAKQAISRALKGKRRRGRGGLSTRAKVGIGLGAAAALGGVAGYRRLTSSARAAGNDNIALQERLKGERLTRGERRDAYKSGFKGRADQQVQGMKDSARAFGQEKMRQAGNVGRNAGYRVGQGLGAGLNAGGRALNAVRSGAGSAGSVIGAGMKAAPRQPGSRRGTGTSDRAATRAKMRERKQNTRR